MAQSQETSRSEFFKAREHAEMVCSAKFEEESPEWDKCIASQMQAAGF